jgi:hypothetical protein
VAAPSEYSEYSIERRLDEREGSFDAAGLTSTGW